MLLRQLGGAVSMINLVCYFMIPRFLLPHSLQYSLETLLPPFFHHRGTLRQCSELSWIWECHRRLTWGIPFVQGRIYSILLSWMPLYLGSAFRVTLASKLGIRAVFKDRCQTSTGKYTSSPTANLSLSSPIGCLRQC
jgi:hypothetical protein